MGTIKSFLRSLAIPKLKKREGGKEVRRAGRKEGGKEGRKEG